VFVAASSRCFSDKPFEEALRQIMDLEYDKVEIWMSEESDHLKPSVVVADPEKFFATYREVTRLSPIAFCFGSEVTPKQFEVFCKLAKQMRITQITVPASPLGTPFNAEIDRLKELLVISSQDGIRLSIPTRTGDLTEDPRTAVELCQATPGLGLTLDPSYYLCGPHRAAGFDQVYPYTFHTHLRDTSETQIQVKVGLGEVDYSRLISQLNRSRYARALSVDLFPELIETDQRPIEMRKLRLLLESLL